MTMSPGSKVWITQQEIALGGRAIGAGLVVHRSWMTRLVISKAWLEHPEITVILSSVPLVGVLHRRAALGQKLVAAAN